MGQFLWIYETGRRDHAACLHCRTAMPFAFFILLPFFMKRLRKTDGKILKYSAITGFLIAGVFIGVIYGVIGTSASTAGFLISTSVIMVPILHGLWIQRMPSFPSCWAPPLSPPVFSS